MTRKKPLSLHLEINSLFLFSKRNPEYIIFLQDIRCNSHPPKKKKILGWMKCFEIFWKHEAQFLSFRCFCRGCDFTFCATNVLDYFHNVIVYFVLVKHKFPITLQIRLKGFQITQWVKQYIMCQRSNYHDTANHSTNLTCLELLRLRSAN